MKLTFWPQHLLAVARILGVCLIFALSACSTLTTSPSGSNSSKIEQASLSTSEPEDRTQALTLFLQSVSQKHHISLTLLEQEFSDTRIQSSIQQLVMPAAPGFQKNWRVYRSRFIEPRRLKAGIDFWTKHQEFIQEVSDRYGVPAEIIVAIIGVETIYGKNTGNFKVKDALTTLAFHYPDARNKVARQKLFKEQLEEFILLCNEHKGVNFSACINQRGSYAGAIGLPQFMPSSIRKFAVDGDGDGIIDLKNSSRDAIASVANFLKMHGWVTGEPIYLPLSDHPEANSSAKQLWDGEPKTNLKLSTVLEKNIVQSSPLPVSTPALIVDLPSPSSDGQTQIDYVVGLRNFIVICDYNRSFFYAQSVAEFAETLQTEMNPSEKLASKKPKKANSKKIANKTKKTASH